jgi:transketolase
MSENNVQMRDAFLSVLYKKAIGDPDIILLTNDQGAISLDDFKEKLPNQFFNIGISEQNIISVAAGLVLSGKKVYVYSLLSFIFLRCYEQIKIDLCAMKLPVTIVGVGAGYSYSPDGPTHHATEDISIMRALPNINIYSPSDSNIVPALVDITLKSKTPSYIRLDRELLPLLYDKDHNVHEGFSILREGNDVTVISTGVMVHRALEVAEELHEQSIQAKVIDFYRLKPIDVAAVIKILKGTSKIVVLEEQTINGGLGSIIAEILVDSNVFIPLKRLAILDNMIFDYGSRDTLHKARGLDKMSIVHEITKLFK